MENLLPSISTRVCLLPVPRMLGALILPVSPITIRPVATSNASATVCAPISSISCDVMTSMEPGASSIFFSVSVAVTTIFSSSAAFGSMSFSCESAAGVIAKIIANRHNANLNFFIFSSFKTIFICVLSILIYKQKKAQLDYISRVTPSLFPAFRWGNRKTFL